MNQIATKVDLFTGSWCGDRGIRLEFPQHWDVEVHRGARRPVIGAAELEKGLFEPVSGPSLERILDGARSVAILVDDYTRPTPLAEPLARLLSAIREAGIPDTRVKIVVALGTHILGAAELMEEKIGSVEGEFPELIYAQCDNEETLAHLGESESGYPILVNRTFAEADVRIAISGIYPHDEAGFSGGAKILIGALGLRTLSSIHRRHTPVVRGSVIDTPFRLEVERIADRVGLDYSINLLLNQEKKIAAVAAGDFREAFRRMAALAQLDYGVEWHGAYDVVMSNIYPFDTSTSVQGKGYWPFIHCPEARFQVVMTSVCEKSGGRIPWATTGRERRVQKVKAALRLHQTKVGIKRWLRGIQRTMAGDQDWPQRVVYVSHDPWARGCGRKRVGEIRATNDWPELVAEMEREFHSTTPRVGVFACAPLLYPRSP